ncbi:hypothetical protein ACFWGL_12360 [Streptomyces sp. NPDC060286]|uniref:hypothetical protein n=1 Tax=unclassified Streptomyces TaxID=2593676 RepID=UPI0035D7A484
MVTERAANDAVRPDCLSDQMAWDEIYKIALTVAAAHGATIPPSAHGVGPYAFYDEVRRDPARWSLSWADKTT